MTRSIVEQAHDFYDAVPYEVPVPETSLYELLDTAARLYPDRVALDYFGATTTYAQVRDQVLRAARVLHEAGVRAGDTVAIALPNCPQAFVAFYACMRIGAVAAQHNPLAPAQEIAGQLARHGGRVAIVWEKCVDAYPLDALDTVLTVDISHAMPASQRFLLKLPVPRARQMRAQLRGAVPAACVSWDRATASARPIDASHPLPGLHDRAVILHTSGTNGVPKSAPLTHANIGVNVNQCLFWVWKLHEGAETFFSLLPYFHAFGLTFFLCAAVRKAATQVLLPKFDAQMALDAHKRRPVTFFVGVPPMFERILARAKQTGTDISSIRSRARCPCRLRSPRTGRPPRAVSSSRDTGFPRRRPSSLALPSPHGVDTACSVSPSPPHSCASSPSRMTRATSKTASPARSSCVARRSSRATSTLPRRVRACLPRKDGSKPGILASTTTATSPWPTVRKS